MRMTQPSMQLPTTPPWMHTKYSQLLSLFVRVPLIYACQRLVDSLTFASAFTTAPLVSACQRMKDDCVRVHVHNYRPPPLVCCHCHEMCSNKSTRYVTCVVEFALSVWIVSW